MECRDGLVIAAELGVGAGLVVERRRQQLRIGLIGLGRLGVVLEHPFVVAGVLVDRAEVLQRPGLATRTVRGCIDVEGALVILQRLLDVPERAHGVAFGHHQIAMQLALGLAGGGDGQRLLDDREGLPDLVRADQGLALEPLRGGDPQRRIPGGRAGEGQGLARGGERGLGIGHHGVVRPVDGGFEGRGRRPGRERRSGRGHRGGRQQSGQESRTHRAQANAAGLTCG